MGFYEDDKRHGYGRVVYSDGKLHEGLFKRNLMPGTHSKNAIPNEYKEKINFRKYVVQ